MALILTITNQLPTDTDQITSHRFENSGTIGRSEKCDWVLHDPSRCISGKHASISQRDGVFYIMDTSSNGLCINQSETPLGKGNTSQLNTGDHLRIGQFEITIDIASEEQQHSSSEIKPQPIFEPSPPSSADNLGLMDILEQKVDTQPATISTSPAPGAALLAEAPALIPEEPQSSSILPPGSSSDHAHPLGAHFSPPPIIPDNWDFSNNAQAEDASSQSPPAESLDSPNSPNSLLCEEEGPISPILDVNAPQESIVSPVVSKTGVSKTGTQQKAPDSEPSPAITDKNEEHQQAQPLGDQVLLQTLLDAMGINKQELPPDRINAFVNTIGKVVRDTVAGMVTILRARTAIKSEFRIEMTTIKSKENNPLKFSVGTDEALKHMFLNHADGFLSPLQSLHEGFEDIQAHQMAMMAGMQAALKAILKQFDPALLEKIFEHAEDNKSPLPIHSHNKANYWDSCALYYQKLKKNLLPGNKKAKYWKAYAVYYQELMRHIEDDFQTQFGQEFTLIYEEQVARLKSAKKRR